jgi:hypothetical protein
MPQEYMDDQLVILEALRLGEGISYRDLRACLKVWSEPTYLRMLKIGLVQEVVGEGNTIIVFSTQASIPLIAAGDVCSLTQAISAS